MSTFVKLGWFVAVGCTAAAVHFGVVVALVSGLGLPPLAANVAGWLVAFVVSFLGQWQLTFRAHGAPWLQALRRFALELQDQIGRSRASSSIDPDLQKAVGQLNYSPTVWLWNLSVSLAPASSSESQYRAAMRALESYNDRLTHGQAVFEPRADNLMTTLDGIGKDLGDASSRVDDEIDQNSGNWLDLNADDVFYKNKGIAYAYAIILRDLGTDFKQIIQEKGADNVWQKMIGSLNDAAALRPWVVINGRPDALLQPNHLAAEGFYIQRARTQLYEMIDILQK